VLLKKNKSFFMLMLCSHAAVLLLSAVAHAQVVEDERPNILLLIADDLGYADVGAYGGDIETPNIDSLAERGVLFTQFHTAPLCSQTRAMLLSGNNNHIAGVGRQAAVGLVGVPFPGFEASLSPRIAPLPGLLRDAGYHTYTVGKWHLGRSLEKSPHAAGFSRAFNLLEGSGSHFDATGIRTGGSTYREDTEMVEWPEGRYSTDLYTDRLIGFIDEDKGANKPFFAMVSYTSPHWPLQVPDEYLDLYAGRYDDGYDALRLRRFDSLKEAGIIPVSSIIAPRNDENAPWEFLSPEKQRRESREMELYASMVDNLDDHIGRLITYLKTNDLYDNTLIVFMSDNGAAGKDYYERGQFHEYVSTHYDNAYEKMGTAASFVSYDQEWAAAGSAPFHRYKGYSREGGIVAPIIIAGPGVASAGLINPTYMTVMDLAPTFIEIAGAHYPDDGSVVPMLGESAKDLLAGVTTVIHDDDYVTAVYNAGRAYLRQGNWKIANLEAPFDEADFELFDLSTDPGESTNLAEEEPEKYTAMIDLWRVERWRLGIVLPQDL